MVANIFTTDPPTLVDGSNSTFSEHDHVAYQIKNNYECSNTVANILPADPPPPPAGGGGGKKVKIQPFQNSTFYI